MRSPVSAAIAIAMGLIVLAGYFIANPILQAVRSVILGWAVILAGIAMLVGIINLIIVHVHKAIAPVRRNYYSIVLLVGLAATVVAGVVLGTGDARFQRVVTAIQEPVEISLLAVLTVTLAYAGLRLFQRRSGWMPVVFLISAVVFLLMAANIFAGAVNLPVIGDLLGFLSRLLVAGARGLLLGMALGGLTAGLRILIGADRPYSG